MPLITNLKVQVNATLSKALDLATAVAPLSKVIEIALASGTGANQADKLWHDQITINASATQQLDLAGVLTDALGDGFSPARLKAVIVAAAGTNTNNVNVQRPASNGAPLFLAAGDGIAVQPGGVFVWVAPGATGVPVTAGTGDLLDLVNSGGGSTVTCDVIVIGASA